jgi:hypothetical protein
MSISHHSQNLLGELFDKLTAENGGILYDKEDMYCRGCDQPSYTVEGKSGVVFHLPGCPARIAATVAELEGFHTFRVLSPDDRPKAKPVPFSDDDAAKLAEILAILRSNQALMVKAGMMVDPAAQPFVPREIPTFKQPPPNNGYIDEDFIDDDDDLN